MSRVKELAKSSASILASQVTIAIISLLFLAYFARIFTKQQMAMLAIVEMLTAWTQLLGSMGLGTLAIKDVANLLAKGNDKGAKLLISNVVFYKIATFIIISLLFYIVSPLIANISFQSTEYISIIRFLVIISLVASIQMVFFEIQVATQRFPTNSAITAGTVLGQKIFSVLGFFIDGFYGFFIGFFIATLISAFITLYDIRKYLLFNILPFTSMFKQSHGYMWLDLLRGTFNHIDQPVIAFLMGAETLAIYYIAKRIYDYALRLLTAVTVPIGVKFGEVMTEGKEILRNYYQQSFNIISTLFIPMGFFIMLVSEPVILLFVGNKYFSAVPIAAAFGFTLMCASVWAILREAALRLLLAKHLIYQYISTLLFTLTGYFILIPQFSSIGIPIATGVGYIGGIIPIIYLIRKHKGFRVSIKNLFLAIGGGICILLLFIPTNGISNLFIQLIAVSILSGLIYLIWLYYLGPPEIKHALKKTTSKLSFLN